MYIGISAVENRKSAISKIGCHCWSKILLHLHNSFWRVSQFDPIFKVKQLEPPITCNGQIKAIRRAFQKCQHVVDRWSGCCTNLLWKHPITPLISNSIGKRMAVARNAISGREGTMTLRPISEWSNSDDASSYSFSTVHFWRVTLVKTQQKSSIGSQIHRLGFGLGKWDLILDFYPKCFGRQTIRNKTAWMLSLRSPAVHQTLWPHMRLVGVLPLTDLRVL